MALFVLVVGDRLYDVLDGSITIPLEGAGRGELALGEDVAPGVGTASVRVAREDGSFDSFDGTITLSRAFEGRVFIEFVFGSGGLASGATAIHRTAGGSAVELGEVVKDIVAGAGEVLADGVAAALAGRTGARWTLVAGESWARSLTRATRRHGLAWRVLSTGQVWVGVESWPVVELGTSLLIDDDVSARTLHVAFDSAIFRPGTTIEGQQIARVTYWSDGRAEFEYEESDIDLLRKLVARLSAPSPYALSYEATVVVQNNDGTLDVRLINGPIVDLPRVPFVSGSVGGRYVIANGDVVRVAFLGGREDGAFAFAIAGDGAASKAVARVGDSVDGTWLLLVATSPGVYVLQAVPANTPGAIHVTGVIDSGSSEVFIR